MELRPKKLALLISVIGAGVSPYAYARSDLRAVGAVESPLSIALDESAVSAMAPAWRAEDGALELVSLPEGLQDSIWLTTHNDLVPEEAREEAREETRDEVRDEVRDERRDERLEAAPELPNEFSDVAPGEVPGETPVSVVARESSTPSEAASQKVVTLRQIRTAPARSAVVAAPTHSQRLMESLAAMLLEDVSALDGELSASAPVAQTSAPTLAPDASDEPVGQRMRAADPNALRVEQREIVVAPPAEKVLRDLEFVLSGEDVASEETIVPTQADKVLATLEDIFFAQRASEDPAERRARKFAAAQERTEAAAEEQPRATPIALAARAAMQVDIDLTQLMPVEPIAATSPADDVAAAPFAMEPGPMQWFVGAQSVAANAYIEPSETAQDPRPSPFSSDKVAINEKSLDRIRGGFVGDGLSISFGIERAVYVNGALVTTTSLNLSDLGRITAGRGATSFDSGTLALVQSGSGNVVTPGTFSSTSIGTVVQNTLNGQKIQSVTVINATVNSLGVLRGLNLQSSMRGAMIDSLRR